MWSMLISREILSFAKFWIHHWKDLEKLCYCWKNGWTIPKGCLATAVFRLKKGYFQRPISPGVRLTLTPDPHQWKLWTFYLPRIPTLGGWRTNAWPTNRPWSEPSLPFPEISNIQEVNLFFEACWASFGCLSYQVSISYFRFYIWWLVT